VDLRVLTEHNNKQLGKIVLVQVAKQI
jgi:hypothetical protein